MQPWKKNERGRWQRGGMEIRSALIEGTRLPYERINIDSLGHLRIRAPAVPAPAQSWSITLLVKEE